MILETIVSISWQLRVVSSSSAIINLVAGEIPFSDFNRWIVFALCCCRLRVFARGLLQYIKRWKLTLVLLHAAIMSSIIIQVSCFSDEICQEPTFVIGDLWNALLCPNLLTSCFFSNVVARFPVIRLPPSISFSFFFLSVVDPSNVLEVCKPPSFSKIVDSRHSITKTPLRFTRTYVSPPKDLCLASAYILPLIPSMDLITHLKKKTTWMFVRHCSRAWQTFPFSPSRSCAFES